MKSPTRINYIYIIKYIYIYVYIRLMINNLNCVRVSEKHKQLLFKFKKLYKLYATKRKQKQTKSELQIAMQK